MVFVLNICGVVGVGVGVGVIDGAIKAINWAVGRWKGRRGYIELRNHN